MDRLDKRQFWTATGILIAIMVVGIGGHAWLVGIIE